MAFESKLDKAWNLLIERYDILNEIKKNGIFEITASQIKQYHEPRLMTKFDWSSERPKEFNKHHISILPNSRGSYILGKFDAYEPLKYSEEKPQNIPMTQWVRSFDSFPITSESLALNIAQMTGMVDIVLNNYGNEVTPNAVSTLTGRLKSGLLDFDINFLGNGNNKYHFDVTNSQIEIDAGFETMDKLAVIEAKNRVPSDFMIRQLYYPYRLFNTLNTGKKVIPIFFTHADDIYSFHIFKFNELKNYSSIEKVNQISFIVDQILNIEISTVKQISDISNNETEFPVTFPQADSFSNLMDILQFMDTPKNKYQIAEFLGYNERQGDYYGNALRYLGLAKKK